MKQTWPPVIVDAAQPRWTFWRDRILTVAAWLIFLLILERESVLFWRRLTATLAPAANENGAEWEFRLLPFLEVAAVLILLLAIAAERTRRRRSRFRGATPPEPLDIATEAARRGLTPDSLAAARALKSVAVTIDQTGGFHLAPSTGTEGRARQD